MRKLLPLIVFVLFAAGAARAACTGGVSSWNHYHNVIGNCQGLNWQTWQGWNPVWTDGGTGSIGIVLAVGTCNNQWASEDVCPVQYWRQATVTAYTYRKFTKAEVFSKSAREQQSPPSCQLEAGITDRKDTYNSCDTCGGTGNRPPCLDPGSNGPDFCTYTEGCPNGYGLNEASGCCEEGYSPILIDVAGDGFALTDAEGGVPFDFHQDGSLELLSWTLAGSDDAWLTLDLDGNGRVGGGRELFGNLSPQSVPAEGERRNGFRALAEYDKPAQGGNGDGVMSKQDAIFPSLCCGRTRTTTASPRPVSCAHCRSSA